MDLISADVVKIQLSRNNILHKIEHNGAKRKNDKTI